MCNLKKTKAIFVDIDGTLTNSKKEVTKENAEAIKKAVEKGIFVIICSGRNFSYAVEKSKKANASNIVIVSNGAQIYDYSKQHSIYEENMDKKVVKKLVNELRKEGVEFILNTSNTRFGSRGLVRKMDDDELFFDEVDDVGEEQIVQLVIEVDNYKTMDKAVKTVEQYETLQILSLTKAYLEKDFSVKHFYADVNTKGINKGKGIKKFLELYNIKKEEVVCFGDYINDNKMFDECGYKVAMKNASNELKEKADYITLSNDESGVAYFINKFILD